MEKFTLRTKLRHPLDSGISWRWHKAQVWSTPTRQSLIDVSIQDIRTKKFSRVNLFPFGILRPTCFEKPQVTLYYRPCSCLSQVRTLARSRRMCRLILFHVRHQRRKLSRRCPLHLHHRNGRSENEVIVDNLNLPSMSYVKQKDA